MRASPIRIDFGQSKSIGRLDGFYRGTQLQGHLLSSRQGLRKVPDFLSNTSFPYRKRPYPEEILFTDRISTVRFVGGWAHRWPGGEHPEERRKADLAYVDANGKVGYRWELVAPRLDPYIAMGYRDIVISLDNVPYDLAAYDSQGSYGQVAPPRDYDEWEQFVEGLCRLLVRVYGYDLPNSWRFRMGTENSGAKRGLTHTFDGDHDQWIQWYDHTARAVKRILPGAGFGPGEFQGRVPEGGPEPPAVSYTQLAEHCATEGVPFDFLANSSHCVPRWVDGEIFGCALPEERVEWNVSSYRNVLGPYPRLRGIPIYLFQFGVLQSEIMHDGANLVTSEPGGRGAAWSFHVLMGMKTRTPDLSGVWHWDTVDKLSVGPDEITWPRDREEGEAGTGQVEILLSNGWVYSILDHLQGGNASTVQVLDSSGGLSLLALYVAVESAGYLVVSAIGLDRSDFAPRSVSIGIPQQLLGREWESLGGGSVEETEITEDNCAHAAIKRDLARAGCLKPGYASTPVLAQMRFLIDPDKDEEARAVIRAHAEDYTRILIDTLTLEPFAGGLSKDSEGVELTCTIVPGSVKVIALNRKKESKT